MGQRDKARRSGAGATVDGANATFTVTESHSAAAFDRRAASVGDAPRAAAHVGARRRAAAAIVLAAALGWLGFFLAEPMAGVQAVTVPAMADLSGSHGGNSVSFVRIHIVPHSDMPADQSAKLVVRDRLLPEIARVAQSVAQSIGGLDRDPAALAAALHRAFGDEQVQERLRQRAEAVLRDLGMDYGARVAWGVEELSDAHRAQMNLPGTAHPTLRVILGAGAGGNWWCVLFPPLCFVGPGQAVELQGLESDGHRGPADDAMIGFASNVPDSGAGNNGFESTSSEQGREVQWRLRVLAVLGRALDGHQVFSWLWE